MTRDISYRISSTDILLALPLSLQQVTRFIYFGLQVAFISPVFPFARSPASSATSKPAYISPKQHLKRRWGVERVPRRFSFRFGSVLYSAFSLPSFGGVMRAFYLASIDNRHTYITAFHFSLATLRLFFFSIAFSILSPLKNSSLSEHSRRRAQGGGLISRLRERHEKKKGGMAVQGSEGT